MVTPVGNCEENSPKPSRHKLRSAWLRHGNAAQSKAAQNNTPSHFLVRWAPNPRLNKCIKLNKRVNLGNNIAFYPSALSDSQNRTSPD